MANIKKKCWELIRLRTKMLVFKIFKSYIKFHNRLKREILRINKIKNKETL